MICRFKISIVHPGGKVTEAGVPIKDHSSVLERMETMREIMQNITPLLPAGTEVYLTVKSKANEKRRRAGAI